MMKTFYEFVLTYRGANNEKGRFAEAVFEDSLFPRSSTAFQTVSNYVEMQANENMKAATLDEIWDEYAAKYSF